MYPTFPSFRRQPPDAPQHRFNTPPLSVLAFPISRVWASALASQLAATGNDMDDACDDLFVIPALSTWGVIVLTLSVLTAATLILARRRTVRC